MLLRQCPISSLFSFLYESGDKCHSNGIYLLIFYFEMNLEKTKRGISQKAIVCSLPGYGILSGESFVAEGGTGEFCLVDQIGAGEGLPTVAHCLGL